MACWNRLKQLALIGLLLVLGACGGGAADTPPPAFLAGVELTTDAQGNTPPTWIMAAFSSRVREAPADFFVISGSCTRLPAQVTTLDATSKIITIRLSGAICDPGQTLTFTLNPFKVVLENATLANATVWTRSFTIVPASQKIGGTVSGLTGVVGLKNNAGETLLVSSNGAFGFPTLVNSGQSYNVTVDSQPTGQTCSVSQGSGIVGTNAVDNISVVCAVASFKVSGTVAGLSGALELLNNGGDSLTMNADGAFTFSTPVAFGASYAVTVRSQPASQTCTVSGGSGTMAMGDVNNVVVVCSVKSFSVSGTVSGLVGTVNVRNNGGPLLAVSANGPFTFPTAVAYGSPYAVTISTQPLNQTCILTNGTGTMGAGNVTNVTLACATSIFSAGNTYNGTLGGGDVFTGPIAGLNGSTFNGNAADTDAITLTTAGTVNINNGTTGGTLTNIKVLNLADGTNTIAFANGTSGITTVTGGTGDDAVDLANTGSSFLAGSVNLGTGNNVLKLENKTYTGTFSAGAGSNDTLYLFNGSNIAGANVTGFENLVLASNATVTMAANQLSQFTGSVTAAGTETINLATAGTFTALPSVENYNLANGTNNFTSTNVAVTVAGGSGNDTFNFTANQIINYLTSVDGGAGTNALNIGATTTQTIDLTTKVSNIQTINVAGSIGTATFSNVNGAGVTLNYTKSTGNNTINLGTGGQTLNLLGSSSSNTTITAGVGLYTINLPVSGSGSETLTESGPNMSNKTQVHTVGNFNATGTDYFKTGVAAATVGSYIIGNADTSNYLSTIAAGLSVVLNNTGQSYLITIQTGTAAGTYLFQNTGSDTSQFDNTDFFVRLTGTVGTIGSGNMIP